MHAWLPKLACGKPSCPATCTWRQQPHAADPPATACPQAHKVYVQHLMEQHAEELYTLIAK